MIHSLERFILDEDMLDRASINRHQALEKELGLHVFRQRFAEFVGIQEDELYH